VTLACREWDGNGSLVAFVLSLNVVRRHLTAPQRAALGVEVERYLAVEAKERQAAAAEQGNETRWHGGASVVPKMEQPTALPRRALHEAAKQLKVSNGYVATAKRVAVRSPETFEAMKRGEVTMGPAVQTNAYCPVGLIHGGRQLEHLF